MRCPRIGLNCDLKDERATLNSSYVQAVALAGGVPILIAPTDSVPPEEFLVGLEGFVLTGGRDYNPASYGQELHPETKLVEPLRDRFDRRLAARLLLSDTPTLGICGGMQLLNVAAGGDLHQHIPDAFPGSPTHTRVSGRDSHHEARVERGSLLARLLGRERLEVNSSHHQAVGRLGQGLEVVARSPDGIVEAIEHPGKNFLLGVQWHPERLSDRPEHLALFVGLVEAARSQRGP